MPKILRSLVFTDTTPVSFQAGRRQLYLWVLVQPLQKSISGILCGAVLHLWVWTFPFLDLEKVAFQPGFPQRERFPLRSEQRPLPPCAGSARIPCEAVLFKAHCRGHWRCRGKEDTEDAEAMLSAWIPAAGFGEAEAGGPGSPRGCRWASAGAGGRHRLQFFAMPASSLASEDAGYPFCQVAAAVGEFLGGNLKFFTALFMLPTEPPVSFGGRGQMSQDHTELGCSLTRSTPRTQQGGFAKQGRGRGFVLSRGTRLPLGLFFPCSISHSPVTNTAELSTELEGGGTLPDGSARPIIIFCYPSFVSFSFFLPLPSLFSSFTFKSFLTSLFIPASRRAPRYTGGIPRTLYVAAVTAYGTSAASGSSEGFCLALFHVRPCTGACGMSALRLPS